MSLVRTGSIKNLSIALEALSRINHGEFCYVYKNVLALLEDEIRKEQEKEWPPATSPARPATTTFDDDIPF